MLFKQILSSLFLAMSSPFAIALTSIQEIHEDYPIVGHTAADLRQQMSLLGPTDFGAEHFDASTRWFVEWHYQYASHANRCTIESATVNVKITYHFPQWVDYAVGDYALKTHWNDYLQRLVIHERGHAEHGVGAGKAIEQALMALPAMEKCEDLAEMADAVAYQWVAKYNTIDAEYEDETQHGATQGAVFP